MKTVQAEADAEWECGWWTVCRRRGVDALEQLNLDRRQGLVTWIAKLADKVVLALYLNNHTSVELAPPATRYNRPDKRKYTVVTPEATWDVREDARDNHVSLPIVVALRAKLDEMGCHQDQLL